MCVQAPGSAAKKQFHMLTACQSPVEAPPQAEYSVSVRRVAPTYASTSVALHGGVLQLRKTEQAHLLCSVILSLR